MKGNLILAQNKKIGSIQRCHHGIVHIHCKGISLHFSEEAFLVFASMIKEGVSKLMDGYLDDLIGGSQSEKEE